MAPSQQGAAGFISAQRNNRRATVVLLAGIFVLIALVGSLVAGLLGGYNERRCPPITASASSADPAAGCTDHFVFRPATLVLTLAAVGVYLAICWAGSARAALTLSRARLATGPEFAELRDVVEQMAIAAGIPVPSVYVVQDPAPNAFATGRDPRHAAVTVTTGLLATMSRRELRGVVAHEIGHIKNRDIAVTTLAVLAVGLIALMAELAIRIGAVTGRSRGRGGDIGGLLLLIGLLMYLLAVPAGFLLKAALSRRREALADATAIELTREPAGLRSALEKLEADTTVLQNPSPAVAHLWIESPLERRQGHGLSGSLGRLFDTHPPLSERIAEIRGYEGLDPSLRGPNDPAPHNSALFTATPVSATPASPRQPAPDPATPPPPGWYPDPTRRAQYRWFDGRAWTHHASHEGRVFTSPFS